MAHLRRSTVLGVAVHPNKKCRSVLVVIGMTTVIITVMLLLDNAARPALLSLTTTVRRILVGPDCFNNSPAVSFMPQGRTGNQMCEYAHLLYVQEHYSIKAWTHPSMWRMMNQMFPNISLQPLSPECLVEISNHKRTWVQTVEDLEAGQRNTTMIQGTPCQPQVFWAIRDVWFNELQFSASLKKSVSKRLRTMKRLWQKRSHRKGHNLTFVGVHVRRGDILGLLHKFHVGSLLPPRYYDNAFKYYRKRYPDVMFLVITAPAERLWCSSNLEKGHQDVVVLKDNGSVGEDLALLSSLEHFVYSHGTFGLWGIMLSRNLQNVVYPKPSSDPNVKRYSHHKHLNFISKKMTDVNFVTISTD